nr:hypothetical protein [uncultured Bradyrhizobium sp.]
MASKLRERKSAIVERRRKVWLERDRPVEACERVVDATQIAQRIAEVVVRVRDVAVESDRSPDQVDAALAAAGLCGNQAQQMQRIEVAWLLPKNVFIDLLRCRQLSPLMQRDGLREGELQGARTGLLSFTCFGHPASSNALGSDPGFQKQLQQAGQELQALSFKSWPSRYPTCRMPRDVDRPSMKG